MTNLQFEQEIQRLLTTETSAVTLSEKIFSHEGLFAKMANHV
jgi:hypothetical protein